MATSGTVGATIVDVQNIIDLAFYRGGVAASKAAGEQQLNARSNLFLMLTDLANDGVNLWCINKLLLTQIAGQTVYPLPIGTVDCLRAFSRTMLYPSGTAIGSPTTVGFDTGISGSTGACSVGITASANATQNLTVQYSQDGITWVNLFVIPTFISTAGTLYWYDLPLILSARAWQVVETVALSIAVTSAVFPNTPNDLQMGKLNRDEYWGIPNKNALGRPLQYWYDKQITPQIWVWQVPNDPTQLMMCELHMHVQDVGPFTNQLAIPQRWLNWAVWELAFYCAHSRPKEERDEPTIDKCEARALRAKTRAEQGESDQSRLFLIPNIRAYSR